jgi:RNA polymerase-binding transcription factor DksA
MDISFFKQQLTEEKARLEQTLESVGQRNPSNPADWQAKATETGTEADTLDEAAQVESFETNEAVLDDLEIRYNEVLAALNRIENNTYGICEVSGEKIEEDRLNADPAARTNKAHMNDPR